MYTNHVVVFEWRVIEYGVVQSPRGQQGKCIQHEQYEPEVQRSYLYEHNMPVAVDLGVDDLGAEAHGVRN